MFYCETKNSVKGNYTCVLRSPEIAFYCTPLRFVTQYNIIRCHSSTCCSSLKLLLVFKDFILLFSSKPVASLNQRMKWGTSSTPYRKETRFTFEPCNTQWSNFLAFVLHLTLMGRRRFTSIDIPTCTYFSRVFRFLDCNVFANVISYWLLAKSV